MSEVDSDFDEKAHTKLLEIVNNLGKPTKKKLFVKKRNSKIHVKELVNCIHSTRIKLCKWCVNGVINEVNRNVDDVKKKLISKKKRRAKAAVEGPKTLRTPTHRLARERIESAIAYNTIRKDLEGWAPIVTRNRLAEQIVYPLEKGPPVERTASERTLFFKPRTPLEIGMAEMLATSKNNLRDGEEYTEAELELLKSMSLKQAREKWAQLQKMRALAGYREAKLKRQAKIKSKSYHRHLKRQKRKKLIKEFEEMMVKDPDAAKEKLEEIDRQRILERATLKHRNGSRRIQQLARYANKNKDFKKMYEEHIKLGRELAEKHGRDKNSDSDSERETEVGATLSSAEMVKKVAEDLRKEELQTSSVKLNLKAKLHEMREQEQEMLSSAAKAGNVLATPSRRCYHNLEKNKPATSLGDAEAKLTYEGEMEESLVKEAEFDNEQDKDHSDQVSIKTDEKKSSRNLNNLKKRNLKKLKVKDVKSVNIDQLFEKAENNLMKTALKECGLMNVDKKEGSRDQCSSAFDAETVEVSRERKKKNTEQMEQVSEDISMSSKQFLQVETSVVPQVSADFVEILEHTSNEIESQEAIIAQAFEDVDVSGDFGAEKEAVEAVENPKDCNLALQGWGSWTGPGIFNRKNDKSRYVIKASKKKRKDAGMANVIISETADQSIEKLQLRSVPFPYTTVEDYEAVVRQPLGKEWNPQRIHRKLICPQIITTAGRIIKPLDRSFLQDESMRNSESDSS